MTFSRTHCWRRHGMCRSRQNSHGWSPLRLNVETGRLYISDERSAQDTCFGQFLRRRKFFRLPESQPCRTGHQTLVESTRRKHVPGHGTRFAPETISSKRNKRDRGRTKTQQDQRSRSIFRRSQRSGCRFKSCRAHQHIDRLVRGYFAIAGSPHRIRAAFARDRARASPENHFRCQ